MRVAHMSDEYEQKSKLQFAKRANSEGQRVPAFWNLIWCIDELDFQFI